MKKIRLLLAFILTLQISIAFGQTKFHLGKYEMNNVQVVFKQDSTFEYTGQIGCFGSTSTSGKYSIRNDTIILDTGIPIEWKEYPRKDDSLKIIIRDAITNKPIPNVRVAFKFIPMTANYLLTDNNGSISVVRNNLESVFIDRGVIDLYNDTASMKHTYSFVNDYPDGKYRIKNCNGSELVVLVKFELLNKYVIIDKEKWIIIDENTIFQPKDDWIKGEGFTYNRIEK